MNIFIFVLFPIFLLFSSFLYLKDVLFPACLLSSTFLSLFLFSIAPKYLKFSTSSNLNSFIILSPNLYCASFAIFATTSYIPGSYSYVVGVDCADLFLNSFVYSQILCCSLRCDMTDMIMTTYVFIYQQKVNKINNYYWVN